MAKKSRVNSVWQLCRSGSQRRKGGKGEAGSGFCGRGLFVSAEISPRVRHQESMFEKSHRGGGVESSGDVGRLLRGPIS